jgi:hypothetical protein
MGKTDEYGANPTLAENILATVWLGMLVTLAGIVFDVLLEGARQDECRARGAASCAAPNLGLLVAGSQGEAFGELGKYLRDGRRW